ncbi:MAG: hypothetical protein OSJ35_07025 [Alistipes sp.]|nr:hypothetical protein [Alistipes sp.]
MKHPINRTVVLLLAALLSGCGVSDTPEPAPAGERILALTASADVERDYVTNETCPVELAIEEHYAACDSCLLRIRALRGNAAVLLDEMPAPFDEEIVVPYAIVNKTVSRSTISSAIVPQAAATAEQTVRIVFAVSSLDRMLTTVDTLTLHATNPAPIEIRTEYDRQPLLLTEKRDIDLSIRKANFTGSFTVSFVHTEGQGFCTGDYTISDGETFAVNAEHSAFHLAYCPTTTGVHRLLFTISDGIHTQETEIDCEAYAPESMEVPTSNGVYIHTKNYEGPSFYTATQWEAMENPPTAQVDGIAFIDRLHAILMPLHAMEPLPFCGNDELSSAVEACYDYEPAYPGRWHLPEIELLEYLAFRYYMEPIRACMELVGGTLFLSSGQTYLSSTYQRTMVLYTYQYYDFIVSQLCYGRRSLCPEDDSCAFFPVREL